MLQHQMSKKLCLF